MASSHSISLGLLLAIALMAPITASRAQTASVSAVPAASDGQAWLVRIHEAASQRNYQGTLIFSTGSGVTTSRVAHYCSGLQRFERIEMLDGQKRQVFRHNEVVETVWPASRVAVVEERDSHTPFPGLLQGGAEHIFDHYDFRVVGSDRVAGRKAQVFTLQPRDDLRFGHRLWADGETGLLLRAEVIGPHGRVLESTTFTDISIGVRAQPDSVLRPMKQVAGFRIVRPTLVRTELAAEGWVMSKTVPGFREIGCVKRSLGLQGESPGAVAVLQAVYSDGLTHVSVFVEPFQEGIHRPMQSAAGATHGLMLRRGSWWVTVVGDLPVSTLKMFASSLERRH